MGVVLCQALYGTYAGWHKCLPVCGPCAEIVYVCGIAQMYDSVWILRQDLDITKLISSTIRNREHLAKYYITT